MSVNRGKQFEEIVRKSFEKVPDTSVIRLHDQTNGFAGSTNPCDFIVYHYPNMYAIECKSVHGNTLPFSHISDNQWKGLDKLSKIKGVMAGVLCWWVDKDVTRFIQIGILNGLKENGLKSIRYDNALGKLINGKKKRVFFDSDMEDLVKWSLKI